MARGKFGERLKRERELREVSMDELSKATRISNRFLQALENEDWEKLPGGVFGHGFVRSIARYLGLGEEALLGEYDLARAQILPPPPPKTEEPIPSPPKWIPAVVILVLLLVAIGLIFTARYAWRRFTAHRATTHSSSSVPLRNSWPTASPLFPRSPLNRPRPPLNLSVSISAEAHLRIPAEDKVPLDSNLPRRNKTHGQTTL